MDKNRGVAEFCVETSMSHSDKKFVGEPFCAVFQETSGCEKLYGQEGGVSRFSVEKFLSHSAEISVGGNPLVFQ